jgi:hypothetical protein
MGVYMWYICHVCIVHSTHMVHVYTCCVHIYMYIQLELSNSTFLLSILKSLCVSHKNSNIKNTNNNICLPQHFSLAHIMYYSRYIVLFYYVHREGRRYNLCIIKYSCTSVFFSSPFFHLSSLPTTASSAPSSSSFWQKN